MIGQALKTVNVPCSKNNIHVIYKLVFNNSLYSLECFREGSTSKDIIDYCIAEDLTDDEGEAEDFLNRMVKGKVSPVHIKEMAEDYFA